MTTNREVFVSVDVETSGPIPGQYSLLTIGACLVDDYANTFSAALKPISTNADSKALEVTGLSLEDLQARGEEPAAAMQRFAAWVSKATDKIGTPVFVGLNAAFDWSFVNYYFHRFTGANPFGFAALDIKSLYMGATSCSWEDTKSSRMQQRLRPAKRGDHDALHDAVYQAELFRLIRRLVHASL
jgi:DNA polymerase III alpha subunit (gram-positive type)